MSRGAYEKGGWCRPFRVEQYTEASTCRMQASGEILQQAVDQREASHCGRQI